MKYLLFPLLLLCQVNGQEVLFEGHIYDAKTNMTIPYVNLSFLNTLKGTSTDGVGHFFLDVPKDYLSKQVHISSLGYNDTIVLARNIYKSKRFEMVEESYILDEVVVTEALGNSEVLNPISSYAITSGFSSSSTPWVLALYFPNIGAEAKYVEKVTVFLQKNRAFKRPNSKFRLRIYNVDSNTKKPKNDLLRKSMVLESQPNKDYVSVDLKALKIQVPTAGLFIGMEWLFIPSNWYLNTFMNPISKKKEVEDRFAPTFGGIYSKNQNFNVMVYGMGQWNAFTVKSKDKERNFVPAISLTVAKE